MSNRNNDAWAAIRGYNYQVDLSIDAWLDLNDNEHLELEAYEDIDKISEIIKSDGTIDEIIDKIGQVKHLDKPITLKSSAFIESIVNFSEQRLTTNAKLLFITNSKITKEQSYIFSDNSGNQINGLNLWKRIHNGELFTDETAYLQSIKLIVTETPPQKFLDKNSLPVQKWNDWVINVNSTLNFKEDIIKKVLVLDEQPDVTDISSAIIAKIIAKKYVSESIQADYLYKNLRYKVWELISQKDVNKLQHKIWFRKEKLKEISLKSINDLFDLKTIALFNKFESNIFNYLKNEFATIKIKLDEAQIDRDLKQKEILDKLNESNIDLSGYDFLNSKTTIIDTAYSKINEILKVYKDEIINKITPNQIVNSTVVNGKSSMFIPYKDNYSNLVKSKKLWEGWLFLLTFLYYYDNDICTPEQHSRIKMKTINKDIRFLFSTDNLSDIIKNILFEDNHFREILNSDCIFLNSEQDVRFNLSGKKFIKIVDANSLIRSKISKDSHISQKFTDLKNGNRQAFPFFIHYKEIEDKIQEEVETDDEIEIETGIKEIIKKIIYNGE